ncbi:hypothetical protein [Bilophila wadsworthia]|uniref:hypothetical protein n=1 Tax=Bilophila wadsworthia TaxID=35833 RepID=UPI00399D0F61
MSRWSRWVRRMERKSRKNKGGGREPFFRKVPFPPKPSPFLPKTFDYESLLLVFRVDEKLFHRYGWEELLFGDIGAVRIERGALLRMCSSSSSSSSSSSFFSKKKRAHA